MWILENDDSASLFQTEEERCWLKSWLAIRDTKEGLQNFVVQVIKEFRENAEKKTLPQTVAQKCVGSADSHQINGNYLNHMESEIKKMNKLQPPWSNTDKEKWCCSLWEIAKCFIHAKGYKNKLSADETDLNGMLQIIRNCQHFQNFFHCDLAVEQNICSLVSKLGLIRLKLLEDIMNFLWLIFFILFFLKHFYMSVPDRMCYMNTWVKLVVGEQCCLLSQTREVLSQSSPKLAITLLEIILKSSEITNQIAPGTL